MFYPLDLYTEESSRKREKVVREEKEIKRGSEREREREREREKEYVYHETVCTLCIVLYNIVYITSLELKQ